MAESTVVKVPRDGTLTLTDGTRTYTVAYEEGNTAFGRQKAERIVIRDRGVIVGSRKGDDPVLQVTFDVHMRQFTTSAGSDITLCDVLDNTGNVDGLWTKASSAHEEWNLNMTLTVEGSDHSDGADHGATFSTCIFEWDFAEGKPNTISVTAEVYGGYSSTGPT